MDDPGADGRSDVSADVMADVADVPAHGSVEERRRAAKVGIRENAAVLAALELPEQRQQIAEAYRQEHPDRATALHELLVVPEGAV